MDTRSWVIAALLGSALVPGRRFGVSIRGDEAPPPPPLAITARSA